MNYQSIKGEIKVAKSKGMMINKTYIGVIKGVISAIIISILAILIFAVVLKSFGLGDTIIPYFNQGIKIVGIMVAAYYSVKGSSKIYMGSIGGVVYVLIAYLLFSMANGGFGNSRVLGADLAMGAVIGAIFSLIVLKLSKDITKK